MSRQKIKDERTTFSATLSDPSGSREIMKMDFPAGYDKFISPVNTLISLYLHRCRNKPNIDFSIVLPS